MRSQKTSGQNGRGLSLIELLVTVGTGALMLSLLMPTLSASREQARRQQCAINQKKIIRAYALWGQDHSGFWPPRCGPADGCTLATNVSILKESPRGHLLPRRTGTAYYDGNRNQGLKLVGEPLVGFDTSQEIPCDLCDYPLNTYVIPGWQFGDPFNVTNCPSDDQTVLATSGPPDSTDLKDRGFTVGDIGSAFEFFGTSYVTNDESFLPWRGHGDWAGSIVAASNRMQSPNYNPDLVYRPGAYVAGMDFGAFLPQWNKFVGTLTGQTVGEPVIGAKWHENEVPTDQPPRWLNTNAYHADGHVTFARRHNMESLGAIIPAPSANCFITAEWSLFPLKLDFIFQRLDQICAPSP